MRRAGQQLFEIPAHSLLSARVAPGLPSGERGPCATIEVPMPTAELANSLRASLAKPHALHAGLSLPLLDADTSRETLLHWCQLVDASGAFTDAHCAAEGLDPLTLPEAWDMVSQLLQS